MVAEERGGDAGEGAKEAREELGGDAKIIVAVLSAAAFGAEHGAKEAREEHGGASDVKKGTGGAPEAAVSRAHSAKIGCPNLSTTSFKISSMGPWGVQLDHRV